MLGFLALISFSLGPPHGTTAVRRVCTSQDGGMDGVDSYEYMVVMRLNLPIFV